MTRVESEIYKLLDRETPPHLDVVAAGYVSAYKSSPRVYSKIDWPKLHEAIKRVYGENGLSICRSRATRTQQ
jgi:hypothetical protein